MIDLKMYEGPYWPCRLIICGVNLFTLKFTLESIVCYSHTFENNLGIKQKFKKKLKESCCLASDQFFSFDFFQKMLLLSKIFPKLSGLFWLL